MLCFLVLDCESWQHFVFYPGGAGISPILPLHGLLAPGAADAVALCGLLVQIVVTAAAAAAMNALQGIIALVVSSVYLSAESCER